MATALPKNSNPECSICFESFKTPKILSCGHTFCLECLVIYIDGRKETFPCPFCKQDVEIPQGGVKNYITNLLLQSLTNSPRTTDISTTQPSTSLKPKHDCPNHSKKKEVEYYCQTCSLGLCSKCIYIDHNNHKTLDLELVSTRETIVQELSKSQQFIKNKIEDLEKTYAALLETSAKLKSFCDEACNKISEKTKKIIGELKENCEKIQKEIQDNFDKNDSKLKESKQKVMSQIKNMETDLDTFCPTTTEEPSLTLVYLLTKLQHLQKLCENMKTDIPPVNYVEWREGNVNVCDILGSTVTKPLNQSSEGSGPISTEPHQFIWGSGPNPLYPSIMGNVFKLTMSDNSEDRYTQCGLVLCCEISTADNNCLNIDIDLLEEDNPQIGCCDIKYTLTLLNIDKDKNVISESGGTQSFFPEYPTSSLERGLQIPEDILTDPSEGFIDSNGQFLVKCVLLQVGKVSKR